MDGMMHWNGMDGLAEVDGVQRSEMEWDGMDWDG